MDVTSILTDVRVTLRCLQYTADLLAHKRFDSSVTTTTTTTTSAPPAADYAVPIRTVLYHMSTYLRTVISATLQQCKADGADEALAVRPVHGDQYQMAIDSIEYSLAFWRDTFGEHNASTSLQWLEDMLEWVRDAHGASFKQHFSLDAVCAFAMYTDGTDEECLLDHDSCEMMRTLLLFTIIDLYSIGGGGGGNGQADPEHYQQHNIGGAASRAVVSTTPTTKVPTNPLVDLMQMVMTLEVQCASRRAAQATADVAAQAGDAAYFDTVLAHIGRMACSEQEQHPCSSLSSWLLLAKLLCDQMGHDGTAADYDETQLPEWWRSTVSMLGRYACYANAKMTFDLIEAQTAPFLCEFWNARCWCPLCVVPFSGMRSVYDPMLCGTMTITLLVPWRLVKSAGLLSADESDDTTFRCSASAHCDCVLADLVLLDVPLMAHASSLFGLYYQLYTEKCSWFLGECALQRQHIRHGLSNVRKEHHHHKKTLLSKARRQHVWRIAHRSLCPGEAETTRTRTTTVYSNITSHPIADGSDHALEAMEAFFSAETTLFDMLTTVLTAHPNVVHRESLLVAFDQIATTRDAATVLYKSSFERNSAHAANSDHGDASGSKATSKVYQCAIPSCRRSIVVVKGHVYNAFRCSSTTCEHKTVSLICGKCFRSHWKPVFMHKWNMRRQTHVSRRRALGIPIACPRRQACSGYVRWMAHVYGDPSALPTSPFASEPKRLTFDHDADACDVCRATPPATNTSNRKRSTRSSAPPPQKPVTDTTTTTNAAPKNTTLAHEHVAKEATNEATHEHAAGQDTRDATDQKNDDDDDMRQLLALCHGNESSDGVESCDSDEGTYFGIVRDGAGPCTVAGPCERLQKAVDAPPFVATTNDQSVCSYFEQCDTILCELRACTVQAQRVAILHRWFPRASTKYVARCAADGLWKRGSVRSMAQITALAHVALSS